MRQFEPFDPNHPRVASPEHAAFGKIFDAAFAASGMTATALARKVKVSPEMIRGYRRGFNIPAPSTREKLETALGVDLSPAAYGVTPSPVQTQAKPTVGGSLNSLRDALANGNYFLADEDNEIVITIRVPKTEFMLLGA